MDEQGTAGTTEAEGGEHEVRRTARRGVRPAVAAAYCESTRVTVIWPGGGGCWAQRVEHPSAAITVAAAKLRPADVPLPRNLAHSPALAQRRLCGGWLEMEQSKWGRRFVGPPLSTFAENFFKQWRNLRRGIGTDLLFFLAKHEKQSVQGLPNDIVGNVETLAASKRQ